MKVAHVVIGGDRAGGQLIALELVRALRRDGGEGLVVSPGRGSFTDAAAAEGVAVRLVDVGRLYRIGGALRLARLLRAERVDVIHTHGMLASNVLARVAARLVRVPVVAHMHAPNVFRRQWPARAAYRALDNRTARWCSAILAVSAHTRDAIVAQGIPAELVEVVPNGFDPPAEPPEPAADIAPEGARVIVCVGRIEPAKGQADLVAALQALPEATLVLVGRDVDGHRAHLERLARDLGVGDRVIFTGERRDVLAVLARSEVVVVASHTEAFPLVPLEAMAVARPLVATRVGGISEIVADGETGVLVPQGRPDELARAIQELLDAPERARQLGAAGLERLKREFPTERMISAVSRAYERALRRGPVQSPR